MRLGTRCTWCLSVQHYNMLGTTTRICLHSQLARCGHSCGKMISSLLLTCNGISDIGAGFPYGVPCGVPCRVPSGFRSWKPFGSSMLVSHQDMRGYAPELATGQRVRDTHVNLRPNPELHLLTTSPIIPLSALPPYRCYIWSRRLPIPPEDGFAYSCRSKPGAALKGISVILS
jgi:hypothetical protein